MPKTTDKLPSVMIVAQVFRDGMRVNVIEGKRAERVAKAAQRDQRRKVRGVSSAYEAKEGIVITLTFKQRAQLKPFFDRVDAYGTRRYDKQRYDHKWLRAHGR